MGKGWACVVVASVATVAIFCFMCYLMAHVNPEPLHLEDTKTSELKFDNVIFDEGTLPIEETAQYGVDKSESDNIELFITYEPSSRATIMTDNLESVSKDTPRQVKPAYQTLPSVEIKGLSTKTSPMPDATFENIEVTNEPTKLDTARLSLVPVKGHRRSVSNLRKLGGDQSPGSVILKIIDDVGQSRIEIKLGAKDSLKNRRLRRNKYSMKNKSKFSMSVQMNNTDLFKSELAKNTIISIMPNDSVIIDEYDENFSEEKLGENSLVKDKDINETVTTGQNVLPILGVINSTESNVTDCTTMVTQVGQTLIETTGIPIYKDIYTLKVLFDNETKSIKHSDSNHSEFYNSHTITEIYKLDSVNDSYDVEAITYDISNSAVKNNSITILAENSSVQNKYLINQIVNTTSQKESSSRYYTDYFASNMENSTVQYQTASIEVFSQNISILDKNNNISQNDNLNQNDNINKNEILNPNADKIDAITIQTENSIKKNVTNEIVNKVSQTDNLSIDIKNTTVALENVTTHDKPLAVTIENISVSEKNIVDYDNTLNQNETLKQDDNFNQNDYLNQNETVKQDVDINQKDNSNQNETMKQEDDFKQNNNSNQNMSLILQMNNNATEENSTIENNDFAIYTEETQELEI